jgi:hypothetical protein
MNSLSRMSPSTLNFLSIKLISRRTCESKDGRNFSGLQLINIFSRYVSLGCRIRRGRCKPDIYQHQHHPPHGHCHCFPISQLLVHVGHHTSFFEGFMH